MAQWLLWLLVASLALLCALLRRARFTRAFAFPGPRAWPLLGNSNLLIGSRSDFFRLCRDLGRQHPGGVFRLWVGMRPFVFLYNSALIRPLVTSSTHLEKNPEYRLTEGWLGTGLITSKDEIWQKQRKMLTPCFHFSILKECSAPVWKHSRLLLDKLESVCSAVDVVPLTKLLALDIICETAMGIDIGTQSDSGADYPAAIERMTEILSHRFITPWMKPKLIFDLTASGREYNKLLASVQDFVSQIIERRTAEQNDLAVTVDECGEGCSCFSSQERPSKEAVYGEDTSCIDPEPEAVCHRIDLCSDCGKPACRQYNNDAARPRLKRRLALLDYLLKMSREDPTITDKEIRDQVNTFMFAGHDTISCAVSFTLFVLGHHPEWQEAVVEEVECACPGLLDADPGSMVFMKGLPLLERCIKEALRMYPPSPMVGRHINTPLQIPGGSLPSGTTAIIYTFLLHRDPAVFADPDVFDPDRFLPDRCTPDPFAYIPFSAGPRNCIGKSLAMIELKVIISMVLRRFRVQSLQTTQDLDLSFEIVLKNSNGIHLQFSQRN